MNFSATSNACGGLVTLFGQGAVSKAGFQMNSSLMWVRLERRYDNNLNDN
tara:strand:- start:35 stop:184 length:150 start_codon:yes stop_codon:yes gene_type:complete